MYTMIPDVTRLPYYFKLAQMLKGWTGIWTIIPWPLSGESYQLSEMLFYKQNGVSVQVSGAKKVRIYDRKRSL